MGKRSPQMKTLEEGTQPLAQAQRVQDVVAKPMAARGMPVGDIAWGPRIGIRVGTDRPWRAWIAGHPAVSAHQRPG